MALKEEIKIEINNLTSYPINQKFLKKIAQKVLKKEREQGKLSSFKAQGNKNKLDLSIVFVSQAKIKFLNKKYRKKNQATDVLSFFYGDSGEIVICPKKIKKGLEELIKVLIHGILHLTGYSHEKNNEKAEKMQKKEDYYLNLCQKIKS